MCVSERVSLWVDLKAVVSAVPLCSLHLTWCVVETLWDLPPTWPHDLVLGKQPPKEKLPSMGELKAAVGSALEP